MIAEEIRSLGLRQQALLACLRLSGGDLDKKFSAEDILVEAWSKDHAAWGLRGHEDNHPDVDKIGKELNRRGAIGLVGQGLIERVDRLVYRLTAAGLHEASRIVPGDALSRNRADRELETSIKTVLEHPIFKAWLNDPAKPKYFREAGHFWGIAPGTPARTVRERILSVGQTLDRAIEVLDSSGSEEIGAGRNRLLFDRKDVERCIEFVDVLKKRFQKDLRLLDPQFDYRKISRDLSEKTGDIDAAIV